MTILFYNKYVDYAVQLKIYFHFWLQCMWQMLIYHEIVTCTSKRSIDEYYSHVYMIFHACVDTNLRQELHKYIYINNKIMKYLIYIIYYDTNDCTKYPTWQSTGDSLIIINVMTKQ